MVSGAAVHGLLAQSRIMMVKGHRGAKSFSAWWPPEYGVTPERNSRHRLNITNSWPPRQTQKYALLMLLGISWSHLTDVEGLGSCYWHARQKFSLWIEGNKYPRNKKKVIENKSIKESTLCNIISMETQSIYFSPLITKTLFPHESGSWKILLKHQYFSLLVYLPKTPCQYWLKVPFPMQV